MEILDRLEKPEARILLFGRLAPSDVWWFPQKLVFCNRSFFTEVCEEDDSDYTNFSRGGRSLLLQGQDYWRKWQRAHFQRYKGTFPGYDENRQGTLFTVSNRYIKWLQVDEQINFEINLYSDKEEIKNEDAESGISDDDG